MKNFHIGKRVIKTVIAVAISLLLYVPLMWINKLMGLTSADTYAPTNWYTPFFAAIATVYAMQNNPKGSISQAKIRSFGSVVGGYVGAVIIHLFEVIYLLCVNETSLDAVSGTVIYRTLIYTVTALGIFVLIPITVGLKRPQATFISCLTYLSVTISIRNGGMPVFFFATNRILSTIIGVLVSLAINNFPYFQQKNKDIMFISSVDNAVLNHDLKLSPFSVYKLNDLIEKGCSLTFMTTRALTSLGTIFKDVKLEKPMVVMNGVSVYYPKTRIYADTKYINHEDRELIENIFNKNNMDFFTYLINNGILSCYYNKLEESGSISYYENRKNGTYYSFTEALTPSRLDVGQYVLVDTNERIESLINQLKEAGIENTCNIVTYPYKKLEGYAFLKVNSKYADKYSAVKHIEELEKYQYLICCGSGHTDIETMENADFALCLNNAPSYVKEKADYILPSDKPEDLFRFVDLIYHKRNYKEYLESIKKRG